MQCSSILCQSRTFLRPATRSISAAARARPSPPKKNCCVGSHCGSHLCCKHSLTSRKLAKRVPVSLTNTCAFHTAASPGSDSHTLFSTRWGRFTSLDEAQRAVAQLSTEERVHLEKAINELNERNVEKSESEVIPPSWKQLRLCKTKLLHWNNK